MIQFLYILDRKLTTVQTTTTVFHKQQKELPTQPNINHLFLIENIQIK